MVKNSTPVFYWCVFWAYVIIYFLFLDVRPLFIPDESRYAEISREMLSSGDWITPKLLGLRYFEKPVGGYWLNNISLFVFGETNFSVRFMSALSAVLTALLVYAVTLKGIGCKKIAIASSIVYLSSFVVFLIGTYSLLDSMLTLFTTAGFVCFYFAYLSGNHKQRFYRYALLGFVCGLGFLVKGPIALLIPFVSIFPFMLWQGRLKELLLFGPVTVLAAGITSFPWAMAIQVVEPDFWNYFVMVQNLGRFESVGEGIANGTFYHHQPFWFYVPLILAVMIPWGFLVPSALCCLGRNIKGEGREFRVYLLMSIVMPLLFLSISKGKLVTYILPCLPPLSILVAMAIYKKPQYNQLFRWLSGWGNLMLSFLFMLVLILGQLGFFDKPSFYEGRLWAFGFAFSGVALWMVFAILLLFKKRYVFVSLSMMPMGLMLLIPFSFPNQTLNSKFPQVFIEMHKTEVSGGAKVYVDSPALASQVAYTLRRTQITLVGSKGELSYGLSFEDAKSRYISPDKLIGKLTSGLGVEQIVLFREIKGDGVHNIEDYPAPSKLIHQGRFYLYIYDPTS